MIAYLIGNRTLDIDSTLNSTVLKRLNQTFIIVFQRQSKRTKSVKYDHSSNQENLPGSLLNFMFFTSTQICQHIRMTVGYRKCMNILKIRHTPKITWENVLNIKRQHYF